YSNRFSCENRSRDRRFSLFLPVTRENRGESAREAPRLRGRSRPDGPTLGPSALYALDVPVQHREVGVLHLLALGEALLARLIQDRAGEDVVGAVLPAGDDLVGGGAHVVGHRGAVGRNDDRAFLHAPPRVVRLPGSVEHGLGALRLRREARHVGALAEAPDLALLADLQAPGAIG